MTTPPIVRVDPDGTVVVGVVPGWLAGGWDPDLSFTDEDRAELDAIAASSAPAIVAGGPGSGPRPGVQNPWYKRGSKPKRPTVNDLFNADDPLATAQEIVNGEFGSNNLTVDVETADSLGSEHGWATFEGVIRDGKGANVGTVRRDLITEPDGSVTAYHDYLNLYPSQRGKGFATAFNGHMEDWYRQNGVARIKLETAWDGRAVWAKAGYDWDMDDDPAAAGSDYGWNKYGRAKFFKNLGDALPDSEVASRVRGGDLSDPAFPTPYEVVNAPGGEAALKAGGQWRGVKYLTDTKGRALAAGWDDRRRMLARVAAEWDHAGEDTAAMDPAADEIEAIVAGGPGSGPRPGVQNPWYNRGSKAKGDQPKREPIGDLFDGEALQERFQRAIGEDTTFGKDNLRVRIVSGDVGSSSARQIVATGEIVDSDGNPVGGFVRSFRQEWDGTLVAEHELLELDKEFQGRGFATDFNRKMEDWYRESGVDRIELITASAGNVVWAKAGYDWDPEWGHSVLGKQFFGYVASGLTDRDVAQRLASGSPLLDPSFPTPYEVVSDPTGEEALLSRAASGRGWFGVKYLRSSDGVVLAAGFSWDDRRRLLAGVARRWDHVGEEEASIDGIASADEIGAVVAGGPGSGPRPGVRNPWYERGSKKKGGPGPKKGVLIASRGVAPDGTPADSGQFGRAFETLFLRKAGRKASRLLGVEGGAHRVSGGGSSTTTPIDVALGNLAVRGQHYVAECKTQHVSKTEYKVSISEMAMKRKLAAAKKTGGIPLTLLQVVDQDKGEVAVHFIAGDFTSFRAGRPGGAKNRVPQFTYKFTEAEYRKAYEDAGPKS